MYSRDNTNQLLGTMIASLGIKYPSQMSSLVHTWGKDSGARVCHRNASLNTASM